MRWEWINSNLLSMFQISEYGKLKIFKISMALLSTSSHDDKNIIIKVICREDQTTGL
jgi:hypothetical protein